MWLNSGPFFFWGSLLATCQNCQSLLNRCIIFIFFWLSKFRKIDFNGLRYENTNPSTTWETVLHFFGSWLIHFSCFGWGLIYFLYCRISSFQIVVRLFFVFLGLANRVSLACNLGLGPSMYQIKNGNFTFRHIGNI